MKLYIINGTCMEYGTEQLWFWPVAAYASHEQAEEHFKRIMNILGKHNSPAVLINDGDLHLLQALDPGMRNPEFNIVMVHDLEYGIDEVDLFRHFDEFQEQQP